MEPPRTLRAYIAHQKAVQKEVNELQEKYDLQQSKGELLELLACINDIHSIDLLAELARELNKTGHQRKYNPGITEYVYKAFAIRNITKIDDPDIIILVNSFIDGLLEGQTERMGG